jgi:hypothetical protein
MNTYKPGDRVIISANYNWARGATGTIDNPPDFARQLVEDDGPWKGYRRFVQGVEGLIEIYWVWFDEPQLDPDGDGPYRGSEIEADAIELLGHISNIKDESAGGLA